MFKKKTGAGQRLRRLFSLGLDHDEFYESLEDAFIEADMGARTAMELSSELREAARTQKIRAVEDLRDYIRSSIVQMIRTIDLDPRPEDRSCYLFLGVNGVGKTTSMAKLAQRWLQQGVEPVFAAGDTFRAAAVEQLGRHAQALGIRMVQQGQGADPSAVIYDAVSSLQARPRGLVMADTAGRMHNKQQLIKELQKIHKVILGRMEGGSYRKLLVIDATTGQNGLQQAEVFHDAIGVDGIILSKYDSQARGGLALSISRQLDIPFAYMGTGEGYGHMQPFDPVSLAEKILRVVEG